MYKELKKIYDRERRDWFSMAITHVVDCGFRQIEEMTEEYIKNAEESKPFTKEGVQCLLRLSKEIVNACDNPTELIQFCQTVDLYDTEFYANKIRHDKLLNTVRNAIYMLMNDSTEDKDYCTYADICEELDLTNDDLFMMGVIDEETLIELEREMEV